jgi:hypothetical protein
VFGRGGFTPPYPSGVFLLAFLGWRRFFCSSLARSNGDLVPYSL